MNEAFAVHRLSDDGLAAAGEIATKFDDLLSYVEDLTIDARCNAIVRTKLEEACFFAKKGYAVVHAVQ